MRACWNNSHLSTAAGSSKTSVLQAFSGYAEIVTSDSKAPNRTWFVSHWWGEAEDQKRPFILRSKHAFLKQHHAEGDEFLREELGQTCGDSWAWKRKASTLPSEHAGTARFVCRVSQCSGSPIGQRGVPWALESGTRHPKTRGRRPRCAPCADGPCCFSWAQRRGVSSNRFSVRFCCCFASSLLHEQARALRRAWCILEVASCRGALQVEALSKLCDRGDAIICNHMQSYAITCNRVHPAMAAGAIGEPEEVTRRAQRAGCGRLAPWPCRRLEYANLKPVGGIGAELARRKDIRSGIPVVLTDGLTDMEQDKPDELCKSLCMRLFDVLGRLR